MPAPSLTKSVLASTVSEPPRSQVSPTRRSKIFPRGVRSGALPGHCPVPTLLATTWSTDTALRRVKKAIPSRETCQLT
jgi:hypothetical protein